MEGGGPFVLKLEAVRDAIERRRNQPFPRSSPRIFTCDRAPPRKDPRRKRGRRCARWWDERLEELLHDSERELALQLGASRAEHV